jgi:hypothetical protein
MGSKREKDRPDYTPEQAIEHAQKLKRQTINLGNGHEMAYVGGVLRLLNPNRPLVPVSMARFRERKRHRLGE